jgi:hypothetical protein
MRYQALILATVLCAGCQADRQDRHVMEAQLRWSLPGGLVKCQTTGNEDNCAIFVNITPDPNDPTNPAKCKVAVTQEQFTVEFKKNAKGKWIYWQIDAAPSGRYVFTSAGIAPKKDVTAWNDNFKGGSTSGDGRAYRWKNTNEKEGGGTFEYSVIVVNESGVTCPLDPVIKNQS